MLINHFKSKKNIDEDISHIIYKRIIKLTNDFIGQNTYFIKKDFETTFEVFSILLILFLKNIKDIKINKYEKINQDLINLFIEDLDIVFREKGIGDMRIGKYVKHHVKKFYFRLNYIEKYINDPNLSKFSQFIKSLNFLKNEKSDEFLDKILIRFKEISDEVKKMSL